MSLGSDFMSILKDTIKLTDSVDRLNGANNKLQDQMGDLSDRVLKLETRLDTYVEIASRSSRKELRHMGDSDSV